VSFLDNWKDSISTEMREREELSDGEDVKGENMRVGGGTVSEILIAYAQGPRGSACQSLELNS
jgi:hypothetical protein